MLGLSLGLSPVKNNTFMSLFPPVRKNSLNIGLFCNIKFSSVSLIFNIQTCDLWTCKGHSQIFAQAIFVITFHLSVLSSWLQPSLISIKQPMKVLWIKCDLQSNTCCTHWHDRRTQFSYRQLSVCLHPGW